MGRFPRPASPWARMGSCPRCSGHRERYLPSEWHHFPVTLGTLASLDALNIKSNDIHDVKMRTTLPFKEAVNRTIRAGLGETARTRSVKAVRTKPHSFGLRAGIDLDKLGQLADELEAEAFAASVKRSDDSSRRQRSRSRT